MIPLRTFTITPSLPERLKPLKKIAFNMFWSWEHEALDLFRRLDRDLWEETYHNPVKMLGCIKQERLEALAEDDGFLSHLQRVSNSLETYLTESTWFDKTYGKTDQILIAYFSAEFGLTECVPNYSGGLGVLSGDHLKSASELGLPLVGIGLLYQVGYFYQYLNADGWQGELYPRIDFYNMPLQLQRDESGNPLYVQVDYPTGKVSAQIWKVQVGRVALLLLDTCVPINTAEDRQITTELYGGDTETRIRQEIMLGIGGIRALKALGIKPAVFHMNEGHSAFLAIERIRDAINDYHLSYEDALELTRSSNIFTTHTPVPAGIDKFSPQLIDKYFAEYYNHLKITKNDFLSLGRSDPMDKGENFSMAVFAIRLASYINGVSLLHGYISRKIWRELWSGVPEEEIPIDSVTNGIHPSTWISKDLASLYDRYLGPAWKKKPADFTIWKRVDSIPAEELWRTHERRRERLVAFARYRLKEQLQKQGALPSEILKAEEVLNPDALTIGFARRFATYKRATLLFQDPVRLAHIVRNKDYPIQIIFAGKAHPKDTPGKELIRELVHFIRMDDFRQNIVFLENYDMVVSRYLVQGVDVWLNTPRRFQEASGTSGMKAAVNGGLNLSILDGWWDEAYAPHLGWAIGRGENYDDYEYQDDVESQAVYNLLEKEVIPLFYERGRDNIPRKWIDLMKNSMREISPVFNTNRMVREYTERFYIPAKNRYDALSQNNQQEAKKQASWKTRIAKSWPRIKFLEVKGNGELEHQVGSEILINAKIFLDNLEPEEVNVEIYHGYVNTYEKIVDAQIQAMEFKENNRDSIFTFSGKIACRASGRYGYTVRVVPKNGNLAHPQETGLIHWAEKMSE